MIPDLYAPLRVRRGLTVSPAVGGGTENPNRESARSTVSALAALDVSGVREGMSYAGDFYATVLKVATLRASGLPSLSDVAQMAAPALDAVLAEVRKIIPTIVVDVAAAAGEAMAGAAAGMGEAIPFVGAAIAVIDTSNKISDENVADSQDQCRAYYRPPYKHPGKPRPADLFNSKDGGFDNTGHRIVEMDGTIGEVFAVADQSYEASGGKFLGRDVAPQPGIPAATRAILKDLRTAIATSLNDPTTDGGVSLWPIYLDLLWSEYKAGHWNWGQVFYHWAHTIPDYRDYSGGAAGGTRMPGECARYERRAYDAFKDILLGWGGPGGLLDPTYTDDRADSEALKAQIAAAEAKLLGAPLVINTGIKLRPVRVPAVKRKRFRFAVKLAAGVALVWLGYWYLL